MTLDNQQVSNLLRFVSSVTPDGLTCDGCLEYVPELAESQLGNIPLTEVLAKVQNHIDNCLCCEKEYEDFLHALHTMSD